MGIFSVSKDADMNGRASESAPWLVHDDGDLGLGSNCLFVMMDREKWIMGQSYVYSLMTWLPGDVGSVSKTFLLCERDDAIMTF